MNCANVLFLLCPRAAPSKRKHPSLETGAHFPEALCVYSQRCSQVMGLALVGRGKKGGWKRWWSQDMFGIFEVPAFLFHVGHNHLWGKKKLHHKQIPAGTSLIPACPVKGERIFRTHFIHCELCLFMWVQSQNSLRAVGISPFPFPFSAPGSSSSFNSAPLGVDNADQ